MKKSLFILICAMTSLVASLAAAYEPYAVFEDNWREYALTLKDLSREERRAKSIEYLSRFSWNQMLHYCLDDGKMTHEETLALNGMVDTRLRLGLGEPAPLLRLLSDPAYCLPCQKALVKQLAVHKDSILGLPEASDYGLAMLKLADSGKREPGIVKQLEQAAAALCADAALMDRMMDYSRAEDPYKVFQSVQMLGGSRDPAAPDSLRVVATSLVDRPEQRRALSRAVSALGVMPGAEKHFDFIHSLYLLREGDYTQGLFRDALIGMANSGNPRAYGVLLDEYDDEATGIVEATHAIEDPELRKKFWNLWFFVRLTEPGMIPLFENDSPEAFQALELLDRASQFGLPAEREILLAPLEAWGGRRDGATRERTLSIIKRFRDYPDPIKT